MEKILSIKETTFKKKKDDWESYDGYEIVTDKQTIKIGISNKQSCCERFGYFITEDDLIEYIGSGLISISQTDTVMDTKTIGELRLYDEPNTMFISFETTRGTFQFVAYNSHNGYYGHNAIIISEQLNVKDYL